MNQEKMYDEILNASMRVEFAKQYLSSNEREILNREKRRLDDLVTYVINHSILLSSEADKAIKWGVEQAKNSKCKVVFGGKNNITIIDSSNHYFAVTAKDTIYPVFALPAAVEFEHNVLPALAAGIR